MQSHEVEMCRDAPLIRLAALPLATFSPHGGEKEAMRAARTRLLCSSPSPHSRGEWRGGMANIASAI